MSFPLSSKHVPVCASFNYSIINVHSTIHLKVKLPKVDTVIQLLMPNRMEEFEVSVSLTLHSFVILPLQMEIRKIKLAILLSRDGANTVKRS